LSKDTIVNHCKGEGCITCKTSLIQTLAEGQEFWASWLADKDTGMVDVGIQDFGIGGIDAFFPKSFVISNA